MDSAGPMTKTPYGLALLLDVIMVKGITGLSENDSNTTSLGGSWSELSVAAVKYDPFNFPPFIMKPVEEATVQMVGCIRKSSFKILKRMQKQEYHAALKRSVPQQTVLLKICL
jgi:hypothetical protein